MEEDEIENIDEFSEEEDDAADAADEEEEEDEEDEAADAADAAAEIHHKEKKISKSIESHPGRHIVKVVPRGKRRTQDFLSLYELAAVEIGRAHV